MSASNPPSAKLSDALTHYNHWMPNEARRHHAVSSKAEGSERALAYLDLIVRYASQEFQDGQTSNNESALEDDCPQLSHVMDSELFRAERAMLGHMAVGHQYPVVRIERKPDDIADLTIELSALNAFEFSDKNAPISDADWPDDEPLPVQQALSISTAEQLKSTIQHHTHYLRGYPHVQRYHKERLAIKQALDTCMQAYQIFDSRSCSASTADDSPAEDEQVSSSTTARRAPRHCRKD